MVAGLWTMALYGKASKVVPGRVCFAVLTHVCNALCVLLVLTAVAQPLAPIGYVHAGIADSTYDAKFGWTMAVNENDLIIGSPHFNDRSGKVSYFSEDDLVGNGNGVHLSEVLANTSGFAVDFQRFGLSVAIHGDMMVVANCSSFDLVDYCNSEADWVSIFRRIGGVWQASETIHRPSWAAGGAFGKALALDDNILAIGGLSASSSGVVRDVVYLYRLTDSGWSSSPIDSLVGDGDIDGLDEGFGHAIALSDGVLVIGANGDDELGMDGGAAYLYAQDQTGSDNWIFLRKLLPSIGNEGDRFGSAVALRDSRCVVGAPKRRIGGTDAGAAYVFERDAGFPNNWGETGYLEPIGEVTNSMDHGASVAIGPDRIAVGAPLHDLSLQDEGSVHVYEREGSAWVGVQRIVPHEDNVISEVGRAGTALAFHGDRLLIGAPFAKILGLTPPATSPTGAVLVYADGPVTVLEQTKEPSTLWPNPLTDRVHFVAPERSHGPVRVLDAQGRVVHLLGPVVHGTNTWDLGGLEAGPYYIQVDLLHGDRIIRAVIKQ